MEVGVRKEVWGARQQLADLYDAVHVDPRQVHLVRVQLARLHQMLHLP